MEISKLITILGPTAVGKTRLAALLADKINAQIISADSRQVYQGMDLGTGKDLQDYFVGKCQIKSHLLDVVHPTEEFNVFKFKKLFVEAISEIQNAGEIPLMCGGTGLYLDAILRDYEFVEVPENVELRTELSKKSIEELAKILLEMKKVHNKTDLEDKNRLLRAIEIEEYNKTAVREELIIKDSTVFGVYCPREVVRERIANRLQNRLDEGMIDEIKRLMNEGVSIERLLSFGLEYKFVTLYLTGKLSKEEMEKLLCIAIQQFSKRQMSWFRRMERLGVKINWIDGMLSEDEKVNEMIRLLK